jgi:hypothetical protein
MPSFSNDKSPPQQFRPSKTPEQFRTAHQFSVRTWKRLKAADDLPRLTWITGHKAIITPASEDEWLAARTTPAPAASPFPNDDAE